MGRSTRRIERIREAAAASPSVTPVVTPDTQEEVRAVSTPSFSVSPVVVSDMKEEACADSTPSSLTHDKPVCEGESPEKKSRADSPIAPLLPSVVIPGPRDFLFESPCYPIPEKYALLCRPFQHSTALLLY